MMLRYALASFGLCLAGCAGTNSETAATAAAEAAFRPPAATPGASLTVPVAADVAAPASPDADAAAEAAAELAARPAAQPVAQAAAPAPAKTVDVTEASFGCIRDLAPVRGFYVGNVLGDLEATLAAANSTDGAVYPVGSIVQLVPGEAMVKHASGFDAATRDWEFFQLDVRPGATKIAMRGTTQVVDAFGGNCLSCHGKAEAKWDMVCEQGHGCEPTAVTPLMAKAIQNTDPRCARMALPADQLAALTQYAAMRVAAARAPTPALQTTPQE